jgi:hypothetical protein
MKVLKNLLAIVGALLALPVFALVGTLIAIPFVYGWEEADREGEPQRGSVAAIIELEDGPYCRVVSRSTFPRHQDTLALRIAVSEDDVELCRTSFTAYGQQGAWSIKLDSLEYPAVGFRLTVANRTDGAVFTVHGAFGESSRTTRYRVSETGEATSVSVSGSSLGHGVAVVGFGSMGGFAAWLALVTFLLIKRFRRPASI